MPELDFQITSIAATEKGLVPMLQFRVTVVNASPETILSVLLHAQIQILSPQRAYSSREKVKLVELFGTPERWGSTLRNRLWTSADTTIGKFTERAEATFSIPCSYDLTFAATKYFDALEAGEVPLLFLFSGSIFYTNVEDKFQVQPISWNRESVFRLPVSIWKHLIEQHYPNSAWLYMRRDVFDRLSQFKRNHGDATWEQTIQRLLEVHKAEVLA